jgi:hypothetical protein
MANKPLKDELVDVYGIDQTTGEMRFFGTGADGSFGISLNELGRPAVIEFQEGIPQLSSFNMSSHSVRLGQNVEIAAAGHHLMTEYNEKETQHLFAHNEFDGTETGESAILRLYDEQIREVTQADESGEFTGQLFTYTYTPTEHQMVTKFYFKVGTTPATEPVTIEVFNGTDDTGPLLWYRTIAASNFPASTEVEINIEGWIEYEAGQPVFVKVTTTVDASLKTNAAVTQPWRAIDYYRTYHEAILSIRGYVDGATYTYGDWTIDNDTKKIYSCNVTGVQTGTFASNIAKWDDLTSGKVASRSQTTGLLEGGTISLASPTTIDWTSGRGVISDKSDPEAIIDTNVSWITVTGHTPTNLASDGISLIGYDSSGVLIEKLGTAISFVDSVNYVWIGAITHMGGVITEVIPTPANLAYNGSTSFFNFVNFVIGPANMNGNVYGPNGVNMKIDVIGGSAFILGSNFRNDKKVPDIPVLPTIISTSFYKVYREVNPSMIIKYDGALVTDIDPTQYDDGSGTLAAVTAGYWTIQRIFRNRAGSTFVAYGQQEFVSKALALEALGSEPFQEKNPLPFDLFRCSLLISESAIDLSDIAEAIFFAQSSFRSGGAFSASSTIPGITSPGGSDTNVQFNDGGVFGGEAGFEYDKSTGTLSSTLFKANRINGENIPEENYIDLSGSSALWSQSETSLRTSSPSGIAKLNINNDVVLYAYKENVRLPVPTIIGGTNIPTSTLMVRDNLPLTDDTMGLTIHMNQEAGDAVLRYTHKTAPTYSTGIDGSAGVYKVAIGTDLGVNTAMIIDENGFIGVGADPVSPLYVYENTIETGENAGVTIYNEGTGDAVQHYTAGLQTFSDGVDNTDDSYKISASSDLGVDTKLSVNSLGNVVISNSVSTPYGGFGKLQNLLRYSEDFTQGGVWVDALGYTTVVSNNAMAPNGEMTADTITWTTIGLGLRQTVTVTVTETYTISFWARHVSGNDNLIIDVGDGPNKSFIIGSDDIKLYSATIVAGSSDWIDFVLNDSVGVFELWGFQLSEGLETLPYVKTLDIPFDNAVFGAVVDGDLAISNSVILAPLTDPSYLAGKVWYDSVTKGHVMDTGYTDVRLNNGREHHIEVYNDSGSDILNGDPVSFDLTETAGIPNVIPTDSSSTLSALGFAGVATITIANGFKGLVTSSGLVNDYNTGALAVGFIYADNAGGYTQTRPVYPDNRLLVGGINKTGVTDGIISVNFQVIPRKSANKSYNFTSITIGSGTYYKGGFYDWSSSSVVLLQGFNTQLYGVVGKAYAAHVGIVPDGPGVVDTGVVGLRVTGIKDSETGVQVAAQTGIITEDITTLTANVMYETSEKFSGQVTIELYVVSGSPVNYSLTCNYGFSKYEDVENKDFTVTGISCEWLGSATDTGFDILLRKQTSVGWMYHVSAFVPGGTIIAQRSVDQALAGDVVSGEPGAWKRSSLNTFIDGNANEGLIWEVVTGQNNTIQTLDLHISAVSEEL